MSASEGSRDGGRSTGSGLLASATPLAVLATHAVSTLSPDSLSKTRVHDLQSCTIVDTVKTLAAVASKQVDATLGLVWRAWAARVSTSLGIAET